jgi:catechol 2,3-dioxygenase-like lactoylglutathione lyase family enzyme
MHWLAQIKNTIPPFLRYRIFNLKIIHHHLYYGEFFAVDIKIFKLCYYLFIKISCSNIYKEVTALIKYKGLHHVSLTVTNLERAKDFYSNILCLKETQRPNFDFPGAWYEVDQQQLHLIVLPASQTIRKDKNLSSREGHFALRVVNYYDTLNWLKKNGVEILEKPKSKSGFAQIFCADPDGNLVELNVDQKDI